VGCQFHLARPGNDPGCDPGSFLFALYKGGESPQILNAAVGAAAHKHIIDRLSQHRLSRPESHVVQGFQKGRQVRSRIGLLLRNPPINARTQSGIGTPGDHGHDVGRIKTVLRIKHGILIGGKGPPIRKRLLPGLPFRGKLPSFYIGKGCLIGSNQSTAGPAFNTEVTEGHPSLHGKAAHRLPGIFNEMACSSASGYLRNDIQCNILGRHPLAQHSVDSDTHPLRSWLQNALAGQNHFHLRGAYPKGHRPESPMGTGMTVATDNGHPRLRKPQLRPNHMDDAMPWMIQPVEGNPMIFTVLRQHVHLVT